MQEWLYNNNILTYSLHNEGKSVIAEKILKTLKTKTYKKMAANDSESYLAYLNKLANQYKSPRFKVKDRVRITKYKNIFSESYTKNWSREIFAIDSVLKLSLGLIKLKISTDKNNRKFL